MGGTEQAIAGDLVGAALADRASTATRMQRLREAVRSSHDRIELALPLLDRRLTRARYVAVLEAFYGFYAPLEPLCERAAGSAGVALDLVARAKLPLLTADLAAVGHTPWSVLALPRCRILPAIASASQAMGALYVMEGATLGGQVIRRHILASLNLDVDTGAAFFAGYGDRTREMWLSFTGHIDRAADLDLDARDRDPIETFATLERWFGESLATP